jgi:hypothetical protein
METNEKLMMLLRLMDEPEATTEAQLKELLADEEVREAYELMVDCKKVYQMEPLHAATPLHHGRGAQRAGWVFYRKIAAIFFAVVFLSGLSFAAYLVFSPRTNSPQPTQATTPLPHREGLGGVPVRFSNVRLDSILTVVSAHYGKAVCFRDSATRELRLSTMWDCEDSLTVFIATLTEFDGLRLKDEGDTLFVESETEEAD